MGVGQKLRPLSSIADSAEVKVYLDKLDTKEVSVGLGQGLGLGVGLGQGLGLGIGLGLGLGRGIGVGRK